MSPEMVRVGGFWMIGIETRIPSCVAVKIWSKIVHNRDGKSESLHCSGTMELSKPEYWS